jgi:RND superfamily putative drug exporter
LAAITGRLAALSARHGRLVILIWVVVVGIGVFFASGIGNVVNSNHQLYFNPESEKGTKLLEGRLKGPTQAQEVVIVQSQALTVDDPAFKTFTNQISDGLKGLKKPDGSPLTASVLNYYDTNLSALVSADHHTTILPTTLNALRDESSSNVGPLVDYVKSMDGNGGFTVLTMGEGSINNTFMDTAQSDLTKAELVGIPIALIVLILVFGTVAAAGLPLLLGGFGVAVGLGLVALVGRLVTFDTIVENVVTMVGLAVGIDYSLLIVERFREERRKGVEKIEAVQRTGASAGQAVLFSGGTVMASLLALLIVPEKSFLSISVGAALVVVAAVAAALTLLPAMLGIVGDGINRLSIRIPWRKHEPREESSIWAKIATAVIGRPVISMGVTALFLILVASPFVGMRRGFSGVSMVPPSSDAYKAYLILNNDFSAGMVAPMEVVVDAPNVNEPEVQNAINDFVSRLKADSNFGTATVQVNDAGDLALISAPINGDYASDAATKVVRYVRSDYVPASFGGTGATVYVAGQTAFITDILQMVSDYTPIVIGVVLFLSFMLLLILFRSVIVPVSAIAMNLLSVGAAYGVLVIVFQHGFLHQVFGFQQMDVISFWVPLLLFAVLFGLSMDYHVFLLSRIRERFDETHKNREAVAFGVMHTGRIITGAALIMVTVFGAFASGRMSQLQQIGFGLAVAVVIDATLIRSVLVPATMTVLGRYNWYLPFWLKWLPDFRAGARPRKSQEALSQSTRGSSPSC